MTGRQALFGGARNAGRADWERFAERVQQRVRKVWPGAVTRLWYDSTEPMYGIQVLASRAPEAVVVVSGFQKRSVRPREFDVNYLQPDEESVERLVAAVRERIRVPSGVAEGALDLRPGFQGTAREQRRRMR